MMISMFLPAVGIQHLEIWTGPTGDRIVVGFGNDLRAVYMELSGRVSITIYRNKNGRIYDSRHDPRFAQHSRLQRPPQAALHCHAQRSSTVLKRPGSSLRRNLMMAMRSEEH